MASFTSGELVWDTTEAAAPRWILFLEGPPGDPPLRLDPRDFSTPQTASTRQLVALIGTTFRKETGEPGGFILRYYIFKYEQGNANGLKDRGVSLYCDESEHVERVAPFNLNLDSDTEKH